MSTTIQDAKFLLEKCKVAEAIPRVSHMGTVRRLIRQKQFTPPGFVLLNLSYMLFVLGSPAGSSSPTDTK